MELAYTITKGHISRKDKACTIPFALVFQEDGVYRVETFFDDPEFFDEKNIDGFILVGVTEKGFDIEIHNLRYTSYKIENRKADLICLDYLKISDNRERFPNRQAKKNPHQEPLLCFIELEGFKTKFADSTNIKNFRNYGGERFPRIEFDHTACALTFNPPHFGENYFKLIFKKSPFNENMIIDFTYHKGYGKMTLQTYEAMKTDFLFFLSFMNGGQVSIRRELMGEFYQADAKDSQVVKIYSFKKKSEEICDDYIPINEHRSYTGRIFSDMFLVCFDRYYQINKKLNLNALVFSINNSIQTVGIEEGYYILITALEKISSQFAKSNLKESKTLISKESFESIKVDLYSTLKKYEASIKSEDKTAYDNFKSRIGGINKNNNDTAQRIIDFFNYAKIPINESVRKLIDEERNQAVHEGEIGNTGKEKGENYWKLDHILRDAILNMIGYTSYRKHKVAYFEDKY